MLGRNVCTDYNLQTLELFTRDVLGRLVLEAFSCAFAHAWLLCETRLTLAFEWDCRGGPTQKLLRSPRFTLTGVHFDDERASLLWRELDVELHKRDPACLGDVWRSVRHVAHHKGCRDGHGRQRSCRSPCEELVSRV